MPRWPIFGVSDNRNARVSDTGSLGPHVFDRFGGGGPPPLILDTYSAAAAYSAARRLRTAYTGAAIRVRRSSDNTEQDIGFSGNSLDTTALSTFVGAGNGFVVTWYDQSGNARDVTQATQANQPRIVNAGTIDVQNFLPSIFFNSSTARLSLSTPFLFGAGAMTAMFVASKTSASGTIASETNNAAGTAIYRMGKGATGDNAAVLFRNNASTTVLSNSTLLANAINANLQQVTYKDTGTAVTAYQGLTAGTPAAYTRSGVFTLDLFTLGGDIRGNTNQDPWNGGYISEAIFFTSALSDTDREAIASNQVSAFP